MRHSDRRLTDQVYLDTTLLPLQEWMRSIEGFEPLTQIIDSLFCYRSSDAVSNCPKMGQSQRGTQKGGSEDY